MQAAGVGTMDMGLPASLYMCSGPFLSLFPAAHIRHRSSVWQGE